MAIKKGLAEADEPLPDSADEYDRYLLTFARPWVAIGGLHCRGELCAGRGVGEDAVGDDEALVQAQC